MVSFTTAHILRMKMSLTVRPTHHLTLILLPSPVFSVVARLTMEEMVLNMFAHIDQLVQVVRPQKVLYLAVDGPAPRAKMNQQRSRRFASARDSQKALNEAVKEGRITEQERSEHFDSNCITPGTEFMEEVSKHFQYFLHKKIKEDPIWRDLEVIYSGHDVPGK